MSQNSERLVSRTVFYTLVGLVALGVILHALRGILAPILLAFLLAYVFDPLAEFLVRRKVPRALAGALCLLLLVLVAVGLFALILPVLHHEIRQFAERVPAYVERLQTTLVPWLEETFGLDLPDTTGEALETARKQLGEGASLLVQPLTAILKNLFSGLASMLTTLVHLVLVPLFVFYFLKDYQRITAWFRGLIPPRFHDPVLPILGEVDGVLSGFLRGQLMVCTVLAILYSISLSLAGIPAGLTIGVMAGLFNIVPYLGTFTGVVLSCLFLLLEGAAWSSYAIVGGIFVGVNLLDGLLITPRILGKRLGLVPVAVIIAILAFSELFGFLGVLIAVPVTAIGKVLAGRGLAAYRKSRAFKGAGTPTENEPPGDVPGEPAASEPGS